MVDHPNAGGPAPQRHSGPMLANAVRVALRAYKQANVGMRHTPQVEMNLRLIEEAAAQLEREDGK